MRVSLQLTLIKQKNISLSNCHSFVRAVKRHMAHVRHNFARKFNFKYNERHVHNKLKDSGNHPEQVEEATLVPFFYGKKYKTK